MTVGFVSVRKGVLLTALAGITLGLLVWRFWPTSEPAVSVPSRVCEGNISGRFVGNLLPERGEGFTEEIEGGVSFDSPDQGSTPSCYLTGGDRRIRVSYEHFVDTPETDNIAAVKRRTEESVNSPGSIPVALGDAYGFSWKRGSVLILDCPKGGLPGILEVGVSDRRDFPSKSSDSRYFADFVAETTRVVAQSIVKCKGAEALPEGSPQLG